MRKNRLLIGRSLDDCCRNRGMTIKKYALQKIGMTFICCLLSSTTYAECTPAPDCASIGYTETSCETTSLKCPFNTSKLKCIPCDSSFKYDCSDTGEIGVGYSCNNKYVACTCSSGYVWNGTACTKQSCTVGMIYYSDKSCSSTYDSSKTAIGVVVKDNELIMSPPTFMLWSSISSDTDLTNITSSSTARADMNGKSNTSIIASEHSSSGLTSSNSAAIYCNSYSTDVTSAGNWYLPAAGELYSYVYGNYSTINPVATTMGWTYFDGYYFWSSSEGDAIFAWRVNPISGTLDDDNFKNNHSSSVSCFFAIN